MNLARARQRASAYLDAHGARADVSRKANDAWGVAYDDIPMMVEALSGGREIAIDAMESADDVPQGYRLSVVPTVTLKPGDRVETTVTADTLTIVSVAETSLDVYRQAVAVIERTAVETYAITIERWDGSAYVTVLEMEAQAGSGNEGTTTDANGATGSQRTGVVTISPLPDVTIGVGDWVLGIPWATGAQVTRVRPVVGNRLELDIAYTTGS